MHDGPCKKIGLPRYIAIPANSSHTLHLHALAKPIKLAKESEAPGRLNRAGSCVLDKYGADWENAISIPIIIWFRTNIHIPSLPIPPRLTRLVASIYIHIRFSVTMNHNFSHPG